MKPRCALAIPPEPIDITSEFGAEPVLVDPATCRLWDAQGRDGRTLSEAGCADLIASFKAQGRQEVAAIVRPLAGDPAQAWEVVCGHRRHFAAGWMRAHVDPGFGFLVAPRRLSDPAAFHLADLDNRHRRDLSEYERAAGYQRALDRFFAGNQKQMAARLDLTPTRLCRLLDLAQLPLAVVEAFASPRELRVSHAARLAPLLRQPRLHELMLREARIIKAEQGGMVVARRPPLRPSLVVGRLVHAAQFRAPPHVLGRRSREHLVRAEDGRLLARGADSARGITIRLPRIDGRDRAQLLRAVEEILVWASG